MEVCCDLEVDVNGQQVFLVDKKILASFSCRLSKLFGKLTGTTRNLKVIFHDFPGGAEGFELIARFCYCNGRTEITPSNIILLNSAANFMEMNKDDYGRPNLIDQTEKSLEEIGHWTWSELLTTLKQYQQVLPGTNSMHLLQKLVESLVERLALPSVASPYTSSSDSSNFQFSCDTRSTESVKNTWFRTTWWFEDFLVLNIDLIDKVIKTMVLQKFDHATLSKFLFYYQKSRSLGASPTEKCKITETVINLLVLLDGSSVSCKGLFDIFRVASSLKISRCCQNKLEILIGFRLHQATLDDLLVPSPRGKVYVYDVNLILRLLKLFLLECSSQFSSARLEKVAGLMDLYIAEVAPDSCLKPAKFVALAMALPGSARDSYDGLYRAMDMYLEVHGGLCEEEKMRVSCALNYEKLSPEALKHLAQNSKFPSRTAVKSFLSQQSKLKSLLQDTHHLKTFSDSPSCYTEKGSTDKKLDAESILLYEKELVLSAENEKLRARLQRMQWRVMELEKFCRNMHVQMANILKSRLSSQSNVRSLPKLCS